MCVHTRPAASSSPTPRRRNPSRSPVCAVTTVRDARGQIRCRSVVADDDAVQCGGGVPAMRAAMSWASRSSCVVRRRVVANSRCMV